MSTTGSGAPERDHQARLRAARRRAMVMVAALTVAAVAIIAGAGWLIYDHQQSSAVADAREARDLRAAELTAAHAELSDDLETARSVLSTSVGNDAVGRLSEGLALQIDNMSSLDILYADPYKNPSNSDLGSLQRQADHLAGFVENIEDGRPGLIEATTALEEALSATEGP